MAEQPVRAPGWPVRLVAALACVGLGACDDTAPATPAARADAAVVAASECDGPRPCPDGCPGSVQVCVAGRLGPCQAPEEGCDGVDNDCDGRTDEGAFACETACGAGWGRCAAGQVVACDAPAPAPETCNQQDDDCDGRIDEAPVLPLGGALALPVGETQVEGLVWFGEVVGLVAAGYPNWVVQLSLPGPSVWQVQRFGTVPHPLATAVVRRGLVVAWPDRLGPAGVAVLGEDGAVVRAPGPIPIDGATALAIVPAGEHVAVAWVARGEAGPTLHTALLDPVAGELTHGPYDLGPGQAIDLVGNGEDGFAVLLHTDDGLWLTRLSSLGEPAFAPVRVAGPVDAAAVQGNYYIEELPVVFSRDGVLTLQRYSRLGVPLGDAVALGDLAASAIKLLRVDRTYGLFAVADGVLYAQVLSAGGRLAGPLAPVAWDVGELHAVGGGLDYYLAWWGGAGVRFLGGPLECPEP